MIYLLVFMLLFNTVAAGPLYSQQDAKGIWQDAKESVNSGGQFVQDSKTMWQEVKAFAGKVKAFFDGFGILLMRLFTLWVAVLLLWFMVAEWYRIMMKWTAIFCSIVYLSQWFAGRWVSL